MYFRANFGGSLEVILSTVATIIAALQASEKNNYTWGVWHFNVRQWRLGKELRGKKETMRFEPTGSDLSGSRGLYHYTTSAVPTNHTILIDS